MAKNLQSRGGRHLRNKGRWWSQEGPSVTPRCVPPFASARRSARAFKLRVAACEPPAWSQTEVGFHSLAADYGAGQPYDAARRPHMQSARCGAGSAALCSGSSCQLVPLAAWAFCQDSGAMVTSTTFGSGSGDGSLILAET